MSGGLSWGAVWHLGWRYLGRNRAKTGLLVGAFTLVWLLPAGVALLVSQGERHLRARAEQTPLVLGQAGSPLELTFNSLYFTRPHLRTLPVGEAEALRETGYVEAIPIYARFSVGEHRIVGTSLDYFAFRGLRIAEGRSLLRIGECVVGSRVAARLGVGVGDALISSPETLFDLAGVYPLRMSVCGVLEPSGSPDDEAVFVDLKTAWIIEGLGHGHEDASEVGADGRLPAISADEGGATEGERAIRLAASVAEYQEVTPENIDTFHFHWDMDRYPVTAVVAVPGSARDQALVKGRYANSETRQLISPQEEMDELFATVFRVRGLVLGLLLGVGAATLAIGALAFLLSHRLRRDEFRHLRTIGASPGTLRALVVFEAAFVLLASLALGATGLAALAAAGPWAMREWVL